MNHRWAAIGGTIALLAVAFGAFGAHGLENHVPPGRIEVYKTGAYYQMVHALGLLIISRQSEEGRGSRLLEAACLLLTVGVVLFSGSLYALVLTGGRQWGYVTPLGGLCFMAGWGCYVASVLFGATRATNKR